MTDRQDFLKTLAEACQKTGFEVHACCLMRNHFHLKWKEAELKARPNGDRAKVELAWRRRRETMLTIR
jgi:REP element-mobilizing transposase RayT